MNLDTVYKVVALGYTGDTENIAQILRWFNLTYGIGYRIDYKRHEIVMFWKFSDTTSCCHNIRYSKEIKTEEKVVEVILKLFRTIDGKIYGPKSEYFTFEETDWT